MAKSKKTNIKTVSQRDKKFKWSDAYIYLIPWIIGILVFRFYPFIHALVISTERTRGIGAGAITEFVGIANYVELFTGQSQNGIIFRHSMMVTFRYVAITVPLVLVVALFIAFILNFKIKGIGFFRTSFYIPSILGGSVSIAILWRFVFGNNGLINSVLGVVGIDGPGWLVTPSLAILVLALLRAWQFGSVMLIFLSALQGVSQSLYEAARMDGAGKWRQFFTITIPIITPVILFNTVQVLIAAFQEFNAPFLIFGDGSQQFGPGDSAHLMNIFIYQRAFLNNDFGIAAAASWILFIVIMIFTLIVFKSSNKWVYYSD